LKKEEIYPPKRNMSIDRKNREYSDSRRRGNSKDKFKRDYSRDI